MTHVQKFFVSFYICMFVAVLGMTFSPSVAQGAMKKSATWAKRCDKQVDGIVHCEIFQRLAMKATGKRLVEFAIGYEKGKKNAPARGALILPLGIALPSGVHLTVDKNEAHKKFDVQYCQATGCYAFVSLDKSFLQKMRLGGEVSISFHNPDGKNLRVPLSLIGFTKALKAVQG